MTGRIVVVGGGLVGTATAYFAAREGLPVTLLEQERHRVRRVRPQPGLRLAPLPQPGLGARGLARRPAALRRAGRGPPRAVRVPRRGRDDLLQDAGAGPGVRGVRRPAPGRRPRHGADRRRRGAQLVGPIRPDVLGASFCSNDAQINTPTVVAALAAGARAEGVDVREGVEVTAAGRRRRRGRRRRDRPRRIEADIVVIATGAWTQQPARRRTASTAPSASSGCRCWPPRPARSTSGPWSTGRWRPSSTRCSPTFRRGTIDDFLAPYETEAGQLDAAARVAARQRRDAARLPDGLPRRRHPRRHAQAVCTTPPLAIIDDFPGLRDVAIDRMWAGVLPFTSDQHPIVDFVAPGPVPRRRPHLRQRRRTDDRQARQPDARRQGSRRSTCPPVAGIASSSRSPPANRCTGEHRAASRPTSTSPSGMPCARSSSGRSCPSVAARERGRRVPGRPVAGARRARRAGHDDPGRARRERARPRRLRARLRGAGRAAGWGSPASSARSASGTG